MEAIINDDYIIKYSKEDGTVGAALTSCCIKNYLYVNRFQLHRIIKEVYYLQYN